MKSLITAIVATLALLSGCSDDAPSATDEGLLQVEDLHAQPGKTADAERLPPIGSYCAMEFGRIFGPSFEVTGVEYSDVDGVTITSLVSTNPDVSDDRIPQIRQDIERCSAGTQDPRHIEALDLGDNRAALTAPAYDDAQAPAGKIAFARVKKTYVIVAVTAPTGSADTGTADLAALLDAAVDRAEAHPQDD